MDNHESSTPEHVTATALQTTNPSRTKPKLIISTSIIIVLIVILLEIYAPRKKQVRSPPPAAPTPQESAVIPTTDSAIPESVVPETE